MLSFKLSSTIRIDGDSLKTIGCSISMTDGSPIKAPEFWEIVNLIHKPLGVKKSQIANPKWWQWSDDAKTASILIEAEVTAEIPMV